MARPPDHERRLDLARQAFSVLRERGLQRVTVREIAEAVGLSRSAVYHWFSSPADVLEVLLEDILEAQARHVDAALAGLRHPIDILHAHVTATADFYARRDDLFVVMIQLAAARGEDLPTALSGFTGFFRERRAAAARLLRQGIELGAVADCDVDALLDLVTTVVEGAGLERALRGLDPGPMNRFLWEHVLEPLRRPLP